MTQLRRLIANGWKERKISQSKFKAKAKPNPKPKDKVASSILVWPYPDEKFPLMKNVGCWHTETTGKLSHVGTCPEPIASKRREYSHAWVLNLHEISRCSNVFAFVFSMRIFWSSFQLFGCKNWFLVFTLIAQMCASCVPKSSRTHPEPVPKPGGEV